jgi:hypothetical protein
MGEAISVRWIDNPEPTRKDDLIFLVDVPGHAPGWFAVEEAGGALGTDGARRYVIRDINLDLQP